MKKQPLLESRNPKIKRAERKRNENSTTVSGDTKNSNHKHLSRQSPNRKSSTDDQSENVLEQETKGEISAENRNVKEKSGNTRGSKREKIRKEKSKTFLIRK